MFSVDTVNDLAPLSLNGVTMNRCGDEVDTNGAVVKLFTNSSMGVVPWI